MLCLFLPCFFSTDISFPIYNCKGTTSENPDCGFLRFSAVFAHCKSAVFNNISCVSRWKLVTL